MVSRFGWVDFVEEDRRRMLDVVHLFRERDTRDELGLGTIRDAFSDYFFPGTSTVQTRVRYMLFIPWVYQQLEQKKVPSNKVAKRARRAETQLIDALLSNGDEVGVIGSEAGRGLKRLPSNIYWSGLGAWGIRLFNGSQEDYHRYLGSYYSLQSDISLYAGESDEGMQDPRKRPNWHPGLPERPNDFPENATLSLRREEAVYLKDRILSLRGESLMGEILRKKGRYKANFPWELPVVHKLPVKLQRVVEHARNFSEIMHGASLLYNLLLSRMRQNEDWTDRYSKLMHDWVDQIRERKGELKGWYKKIDDFWLSPALLFSHISLPTRRFVETWVSLALGSPGARRLADHAPAENLLREREVALKRNRARLDNPRPLELWQGQSGIQQFSYRWPVASTFLQDILKGLRDGKNTA